MSGRIVRRNARTNTAFANAAVRYIANRAARYGVSEAGRIARSYYNNYNTMPRSTTSGARKYYTKSKYKRTNKYSKKRKGKKKTSLKRKVAKLTKKVNDNLAKHVHRRTEVAQIPINANQQSMNDFVGNRASYIQDATANLRYHDPSDNTVQVMNLSNLIEAQKIFVSNLYMQIQVTNNSSAPCVVKIYGMAPKVDSSTAPASAYTTGMPKQTDDTTGTYSTVSPNSELTDCNFLQDLWTIKITRKKKLMPGRTMIVSYAYGGFTYDPSQFDSQTDNFQKAHRAFIWSVRGIGQLAHDTTNKSDIGHANVYLDVKRYIKYTFEYEAGVTLDDYSTNDNYDTLTNGARFVNKPSVGLGTTSY